MKTMNSQWMRMAALAALLTLPPAFLHAGTIDVGATWLKIPTSAQSAGMAGAFSAVGDDVNALGVNPAGLALMEAPQVTLAHNIWIQDISTEHLAYGQRLSEGIGGSLGFDYLNFGSVDKYSVGSGGTPSSTGSYNPMALNIYGGAGMRLAKGLTAGASVKFLMENLSTVSSSTLAGDLGLLYRTAGDKASFALVLTNLGGDLDKASLPLQLKLGAAYRIQGAAASVKKDGNGAMETIQHQVTLSAEGNLSLAAMDASGISLGGEYWYNQQIAVRAGYRVAPYGNLNGLSGFCTGVGVRYQKFELSYALTTLGDLGLTHQISLMTRF